MSQSDMTVDTAFGSDVENALQALASLSKGSSAPSTPYSGQLWLDDNATPWSIKIYDGTDWITVGEVNATNNQFMVKHEAGGLEFDASGVVDGDFIVGTGTGTMGLESGDTARTSLGVGSADTPTFAAVNLGDTDLGEYKEGEWTPVLIGTTTAGTQTYSSQTGVYTRIGNTVIAHFDVRLSGKGGTTAGEMRITGLPYSTSSTGLIQAGASFSEVSGWNLDSTSGYYTVIGQTGVTGTHISLLEAGDNVNMTALTDADFGNTSTLVGSIVYQTG